MSQISAGPSSFGIRSQDPAMEPPDQVDDPAQPDRQLATDAMVHVNRANTPASVADQRQKPRLSIAELNSLDADEIRRRMTKGHDDRPTIEKVLDLVDLPRNLIANSITWQLGINKASQQEGETGALGLPRIHYADAMRALGIKNRLINGIGGFIGDVALDPLTYVGGAGFGAKLAGREAGKTLFLRGAEARSLRHAIADTAAGAAVRPGAEHWGEYLAAKGLAKGTEETAPQALDRISASVMGDPRTGAGGAIERAFGVLGGERTRTGGGLVEDFYKPIADESTVAARKAVEKATRGTGPSLRIGVKPGDVGSEILHVPFTDYTVQVPSFGGSATETSRRALELAKVRTVGAGLTDQAAIAAMPALAAASQIEHIDAMLKDATDAHDKSLGAIDDLKESLSSAPQIPDSQPSFFHGTGTTGLTADTLDPFVGSHESLFGHGIYFTNERSIAEGYAKTRGKHGTPTIYGAELSPKKVLDLEAPLSPEVTNAIEKGPYQPELKGAVMRAAAEPGATGESVMIALRNATSEFSHDEQMPTSEFVEQYQIIMDELKNLGFDAATHTGGKRTRNAPHKVMIVFNPNAIKDFAPHIPSVAATTKADIDAAKIAADTEFTNRTQSLTAQAKALYKQARASLKTTPIRNIGDAQGLLVQADSLRQSRAALEDARTKLDTLKLAQEIGVSRVSPEFATEHIGEELYRLAKDKPESLAAMADVAQSRVRALTAHADALRAPLENVLTNPDRHLVNWGRALTGIDDAGVATSVFGKMNEAARQFGAEQDIGQLNRLDRWWRKNFGARGGSIARDLSQAQAVDMEAGMRGAQEAEALHSAIKEAAKNAGMGGLDRDAIQAAGDYIYLRQHELADPGGAIYHQWKFDEAGPKFDRAGKLTNPSLLREQTKELIESGALGNEAFRTSLDEQAIRLNQFYRQMGAAERADRMLHGLPIEGYVPITTTEPTVEAIGKQGLRQEASASRPGFAIKRTTFQTRFQDPSGAWHRFFDYDRNSLEDLKTPETIADYYKSTPQLAKDMVKARDDIAIYDKLASADKSFADKFPAMPTDPIELNEVAQSGRFDAMTGGNKDVTQFFATNASVVLAHRLASHQRALAKRMVLDTIDRNGLYLNPDDILRIKQIPGKEAELGNGVKVRIDPIERTRMGEPVTSIRIGNERYRQLDSRASKGLSGLMLSLNERDTDGLFLHHRLADRIEDTAKLFDPNTVGAFLGTLDTATALWKMMTLARPSWPIFNMTGNMAMALSGGAKIEHMGDPSRWRTMYALQRGITHPELLRDIKVQMGGITYTGEEMRNLLIEHKAFNNNLSLEAAGQYMKQRPGLLAGADRFARSIKPLAAFFRLNQIGDDVMRGMSFWSHVDQGNSVIGAERKVLDSMMDFADFTEMERSVFRRLIPFYSYLRGNLGYQLNLLLQRPAYAALAPKLKTAIEESIDGEGAVPDELRPGWMRDNIATQIGSDPKNSFALMFGQGVVPHTEVYNLLTPLFGQEGAQKFLHYFVSNLNPVATAPLQIGSGTEFFTGRKIGTDPSADVSPAGFLGEQVGPLSEYGPGGRVAKSYQVGGAGPALARAALGGRIQSFDRERLASSVEHELNDQEEGLRTQIRRAERLSDKSASLEARAQLMLLYKKKERLGIKIPRWAEQQLQEASTP